MRHVGKAEAAIAVGLDRRAAGEMRLADDDAFGHRRVSRQVASGLAAVGDRLLLVASRPAGRSLNRISSGAAMKIDE